MIIKKYVVKNMNEAMTRIRYELGKNALIIGQRKVRGKGIKGFFSPKLLEVTAAIESYEKEDDKLDILNAFKKPLDNLENVNTLPKKEVLSSKKEEKFLINKTNLDKHSEQNNPLMKEILEMKSLISKNIIEKEIKEEIPMLESLKENDVDSKIVNYIESQLKECNSIEEKNEKIRKILINNISIDNQIDTGVIAFVGPTGVGKTTTIAKIAGELALIKEKKVGLITIDTYRIGAVEQLKTYSEIINIPFEVVTTLKGMEKAIEDMKECDVILIDTTGTNSKNSMQISEMRALINKANPDKINLVVSSTIKNKDIEGILKGYKALGYESVIITKLDETSAYGSLINILFESKVPLSYITLGQNVPDDIIKLSKEEVLEVILGERTLC
ncbi:flagellar biosynthesis protein FlhF [Clostridium fallax]|uniref:Flagellar biosynthesis protein FlhF n=1 Tax=Clostridium fallax TaxID=1533 RepID=A0A1M4UJ01_9CLOT|nr:flagellar biosynthesis protein FlhF [Clostridium fallax]SHE56634.1 flagellar biosynthesis protein FlhF [Clostridium fallax]SQB07588.1 flagellar biosynthesis protein flhF [Clostridium fallax]